MFSTDIILYMNRMKDGGHKNGIWNKVLNQKNTWSFYWLLFYLLITYSIQKRGIHYQPWIWFFFTKFFGYAIRFPQIAIWVIWLICNPPKSGRSPPKISPRNQALVKYSKYILGKKMKQEPSLGVANLRYGGHMIHPDSVWKQVFFFGDCNLECLWNAPGRYFNTRQIWGSCLSWHLVVDFFLKHRFCRGRSLGVQVFIHPILQGLRLEILAWLKSHVTDICASHLNHVWDDIGPNKWVRRIGMNIHFQPWFLQVFTTYIPFFGS